MIDTNVFLAESRKRKEINIATIDGVFEDGVTLLFDGEQVPTQKRYKTNTSIVFNVGQRVWVDRYSGTCIVAYPIGNPKG